MTKWYHMSGTEFPLVVKFGSPEPLFGKLCKIAPKQRLQKCASSI